jgi:hypothetical protein
MSDEETIPSCCEIGSRAWRVHAHGQTRTIPAERDALIVALRAIPGPIYALLEGRGVSVRRVTIPAGPAASRPHLLRLQIEKEFPLSPDDLALWSRELPQTGPGPGIEHLVIAVKQELIAFAVEVFEAAGVDARFSFAALAAGGLTGDDSSLLIADDTRHEFVEIEAGLPKAFRVSAGDSNGRASIIRTAKTANPARLTLIGPASALDQLRQEFPDAEVRESETAAASGLARLALLGKLDPLPFLNISTREAESATSRLHLPWKWIALAAALALGLFMLRYAEAWLRQPKLEAQLAAFSGGLTNLPAINQEVSFLQHIQKNQPPYLAALAVLSDSCPRGTKLESVSLDRRGEFTFRGKLQSPQNASELRRKLIESGLFTNVVLEEQNPVKNQREVTVRFSARWNTSRNVVSETLKRIDTKPPAESKKTSQKSGPPRRMPFLR